MPQISDFRKRMSAAEESLVELVRESTGTKFDRYIEDHIQFTKLALGLTQKKGTASASLDKKEKALAKFYEALDSFADKFEKVESVLPLGWESSYSKVFGAKDGYLTAIESLIGVQTAAASNYPGLDEARTNYKKFADTCGKTRKEMADIIFPMVPLKERYIFACTVDTKIPDKGPYSIIVTPEDLQNPERSRFGKEKQEKSIFRKYIFGGKTISPVNGFFSLSSEYGLTYHHVGEESALVTNYHGIQTEVTNGNSVIIVRNHFKGPNCNTTVHFGGSKKDHFTITFSLDAI